MAIMQRHTRLTLMAPSLMVLALVAASAMPSAAQSIVSNPGSNPFTQNPEADKAKVTRRPTGLPGARSSQAVAPAERAVGDMRPTEALFDAVNRGDIAAARDAIGRGAEIEGRNILGLTPLELAVDLARNDITFLLLSMRGASSGAGPEPSRAAPARAAVAARPAPAPAPVRVAAPAAPRQRSAGADPGTPAPQAGFLGFGGGTAFR